MHLSNEDSTREEARIGTARILNPVKRMAHRDSLKEVISEAIYHAFFTQRESEVVVLSNRPNLPMLMKKTVNYLFPDKPNRGRIIVYNQDRKGRVWNRAWETKENTETEASAVA